MQVCIIRSAYLLIMGTESDRFGILSAISNKNTIQDKSTVMPSDTFSPASGGK